MPLYKILLTIITSVSIFSIAYDVYEWKKSAPGRRDSGEGWVPSPIITLWIVVVGICLFLLATSYHINVFDYAKPIEHKNFQTITLRDFRGIKLPHIMLEGEKEFAYITSNILVERGFNTIDVKSLFHPSRSYVFNRLTADRLLLEHELYHFHITEFHARKMRKRLQDLNFIPSDSELSSILNETNTEMNILQSKYDYDTHHGYLLKKQKFWKNRIDSLLLLHSEYEITSIHY